MDTQEVSGEFRVALAKCASCLYVLPYGKATRDALLAAVDADNSYVACHECSYDMREGEVTYRSVCCRGFYDAGHFRTLVMRLAYQLRLIVFVDADEQLVSCPWPQGGD